MSNGNRQFNLYARAKLPFNEIRVVIEGKTQLVLLNRAETVEAIRELEEAVRTLERSIKSGGRDPRYY